MQTLLEHTHSVVSWEHEHMANGGASQFGNSPF